MIVRRALGLPLHPPESHASLGGRGAHAGVLLPAILRPMLSVCFLAFYRWQVLINSVLFLTFSSSVLPTVLLVASCTDHCHQASRSDVFLHSLENFHLKKKKSMLYKNLRMLITSGHLRPYIRCNFPGIWNRLDKGVFFGTGSFMLKAWLESKLWLGPGFWESTQTLEFSAAFITES